MGLLGLVGPQSTLRGPHHQHQVSSISHLSKEFYYLQPKNGHGQLLPGGERCSSPFPLLVLIGHISAAMTPRPPPARNYNSHHAPRGHPHGRRREGAAGAAGSCSSDRDGAAVIANVQRAERELPAPGRKRGWWGRQRGRGPGAGCGGGPGRPLRCLGLRYAPGRGGVFGVLRLLQQRGVLGAAGQVRAGGRGGFRGRRRGIDGRRDGPFWGWASQRYPPQL